LISSGAQGAVNAGSAKVQAYRCSGVSVEFPIPRGRRKVLQEITFELNRAETLAIVGPSGTGKTTLLRVLGGLLAPTSGSVVVNGRPLTGAPDDVVIVFQDYSNALLQWRTIASNVALGIETKLLAQEVKRRVDETLHLVGLEKHGHDFPWQLSGGMQQRVQIARALAVSPSVLLLDEPFGALDAMTKESLQDQVVQIQKTTSCSCIFITHDIDEAIYLGHRVAVLKGSPGRFEQVLPVDIPGERDQVLTRQHPNFLHYRAVLHQQIKSSV
jgi:NitT/TauT family transport system ATP-binding protein